MNKTKSLSEGNSFAGKLGVLRGFFALFGSTNALSIENVNMFLHLSYSRALCGNSVTKINIRGGNKPWSEPESFLCLSLLPTFISDTCKELMCTKLRKLDQKNKAHKENQSTLALLRAPVLWSQ